MTIKKPAAAMRRKKGEGDKPPVKDQPKETPAQDQPEKMLALLPPEGIPEGSNSQPATAPPDEAKNNETQLPDEASVKGGEGDEEKNGGVQQKVMKKRQKMPRQRPALRPRPKAKARQNPHLRRRAKPKFQPRKNKKRLETMRQVKMDQRRKPV